MGQASGRAADRAGRPAMRSPGRPPVARREDRQRFWAAIARGCRARTRRSRRACRRPVGARWFREAGGMPPVSSGPAVGAVSVVRRAGGDRAAARRRASGCARSPAGSAARRRRSRGSCAATPRRAAAGWSTGRRPRSGMPSGAPAARSRRSSPSNDAAARATCRTGSPATVARPDGAAVAGPERARGTAAGTGRRQDRRWAQRRGARSRSPTGCRVDFPDDESMRICHEAIYQALYVQGRGALRRELTACLRTGRALRVPRARARGPRQALRHPRDHDQRAARRGRRPGRARATGRAT